MSPAELNYDIYDKELLAIMYVLDEWRPYLLHAAEPFEIWMDHKNLTYFRQPQKLNGRQARWYSRLQEYNYMLRHIPGATNSKADILSRLPWYKAELPPPNDVTMLPDSRFIKWTTLAATLLRDEQFLGGAKTIAIHSSLEEHVRQNQQKETKVTELEKQKHTYSRQKQAYYYSKDESTFHLIPKYGKKSSMMPTTCQLQDIQASSRQTN
jgi:hypothetical protein